MSVRLRINSEDATFPLTVGDFVRARENVPA